MTLHFFKCALLLALHSPTWCLLVRLCLIYSSLNKQFLLNTHTHNFVLSAASVWLIAIPPSSMNQPLYSLHCAQAPGRWSKGWRRRLGRKIHFSPLPHLQSSGRRLPTCLCPPNQPPSCLSQAWSCSSQTRQTELSGNSCLFLDLLDSSVYLGSPRSQSQRSTSHLDSSTSQARS